MSLAVMIVTIAGVAVSGLRWLRVAQREHYLPEVGRFAMRWWSIDLANRLLALTAIVGLIVSIASPWGVIVAAVPVLVGPVGLGLRGRTSSLAWTPRLRRLAGAASAAVAVPVVIDFMSGTAILSALVLVALPAIFDAVLVVLGRFEVRLGQRWVRQAQRSLAESGAKVVAITGSYGKTSTKGIVAHLLAGVTSVVPSPASFNNRMGLARAINEHLSPGTGVFVAEMGTYGRGEIAELCEWIPPDVAMITAIGPVHLERMGSEENIAIAKREILDKASVAVLMVDSPFLRAIADEEEANRRVVRCSASDSGVDVFADDREGVVWVGGRQIGRFDPDAARASNVACAIGAVLGLGIDPESVAGRLTDLPKSPHRQTVATSERGFVYVDDTFNSNPTGARAGVDIVMRQPGSGRRVVVTPGMVEMGGRQFAENRAFASDAGARGIDTFVIVGRTNRRALEEGAHEGGVESVIVVPTRDDAVAWVREHLGPGDAVLYENDLPDHYA